ncbi:hypothetical protein [Mucilaginibacter myungsuensis]|uniref:Uncharacterized protein n=1 Tax=Mucilaginibacter myungsuensis TaxID=649104 RepID=A0A929KWL1_9SPHI|nr:hypothetical protein [Mucilaginibacter myungsuensis]MBE9660254.1 hypothetical protein [Mucilaginibacter myungsuensis]MDN3600296.1 hypothetical protein [Mucilaginibacter myungsuensis]
MRKLALLFAVLSVSAVAKAQKPVSIKLKYLPKHTYNVTVKRLASTDFLAIKDPTKPQDPGADATPPRMVMEIDTRIVASINTANATPAHTFPATILCNEHSLRSTINGSERPGSGQNAVPIGQTVNGTINELGKVEIDTLAFGKAISDAISEATRGIEAIDLPTKSMKIGDTFTRDVNTMTFDLTSFGANNDTPVKMTYKLSSVKNNMAYFDISSAYTIDLEKQPQGHKVVVKGRGSGSGVMIFDLQKGYPKSIVDKTDLTFDVDMDADKLKIVMALNNNYQYTVKAN